MTYGHLQADCLYTGISSGPNDRYEYGKPLPFIFYLYFVTFLQYRNDNLLIVVHTLLIQCTGNFTAASKFYVAWWRIGPAIYSSQVQFPAGPPSRSDHRQVVYTCAHSLANRDSCPTPAKSEGIEYLQSWPHRN